jgi:integrase
MLIMKKRADGRWQKKITLPNGKSKFIYSTAATERQAVADFNKQLLNMEEEKIKSSAFGKIADAWNTEYRKKAKDMNYRKGTKAIYEKIVAHFETYLISDVTPVNINKYIQSLIDKNYAQKTISDHKGVLNMIFTYAIANGELENNPMHSITPLPKNLPKTKRKIPDTEKIKEVSNHSEGFDLYAYFLLCTGCRRSEALAIKDTNIDFKNKIIRITHHIIHDNNRPVYEPVLKTESAEREIILLDRLAEKLPKNFKGFLFSMDGDGKKPLTQSAYEHRWKKYQKKYNLQGLTAHQLRHAYATMLFEAGINERDAQDLMGHSDITLTRQIYTHIRSEHKKETANKLNSFNF